MDRGHSREYGTRVTVPGAPAHSALEQPTVLLDVVDDFLAPAACAQLLWELDVAFWQPSLTYQQQPDGTRAKVLAAARVSETAHECWYSPELLDLLRGIEDRLRSAYGADPATLEWWQATRYQPGGLFDYHLDAGYWDGHHAGDRVLSFLLYLDSPAEGGGTRFSTLDRWIDARAGRLVVWGNLLPDGTADERMMHSSTPVREGTKTTLVTWQRQRRFRRAASAADEEGAS